MYIIILIYPVDVNKHFPRRLFALFPVVYLRSRKKLYGKIHKLFVEIVAESC